MSPSSLTPAQMQALLKTAEKRLGITPEQIEGALRSGDTNALSSRLSPELAGKLNALLGDRARAEQLLNSPEIQKLLKNPPQA